LTAQGLIDTTEMYLRTIFELEEEGVVPLRARIAERLTQLGFSQYEARTYVGLLTAGGATGYSVANETGVPQPKVYETLRRLVDRGAATLIGEHPARYAAVSPAQLLGALEREFAAKVEAARRSLETLPEPASAGRSLPLMRADSLAAAIERAVEAIDTARSRVYISGRAEELKPLGAAVDEASERGVQFVLVHFGRLPFQAPRGKVMRHASTEGTLYASRKSHHLAVVVDSRWALWAVARDGRDWEVMSGEVPLVASLVKSYIAIRADERDREGYISHKPNIVPVYPFKEAGIDKDEVIRILSEAGVGLPKYYEWRSRSGCYFCFFQRKFEWVGLKERHPEKFEEAKQFEKTETDPVTGEITRYTWSQKESLEELEQPERIQEIKERHAAAMVTTGKRSRGSRLVQVFEEVLDKEDDTEPCLICHL